MKLLILDEPTAALNEAESAHLLDLIVGLKGRGVSSIMISHKLNEIEQIADQITIIRDGHTIETLDVKADGVDEDRIIRGMVGRTLESRFPERTPDIGEKFFEVRDWVVQHPQVAGPSGRQELQLLRPPRRDRRFRRPHGRRPHRARHERLRPLLRQLRLR